MNVNPRISRVNDLEVYKMSFDASMKLFELSKHFPKEEKYALTDQMRRSSRSVCANLAEAWQKRMYKAAFIAKLSDCVAEASETQTWLEFAVKCEYLEPEVGREIYKTYGFICGKIIRMMTAPTNWLLPTPT
jgi:four helix bundle protein